MNKAIAHILKEALTGLPIIDKMAGLVQVAEYEDVTYDETGTVPNKIIKRIPISQDVVYDPACESEDLVPDSSKNGILYFEDRGTAVLGEDRGYFGYRSRLRLVVWLNAKNIAGANYMITPALITEINRRLTALENSHSGVFLGISVSVENIATADKTIFAPYTYDLFNTQYVLPPYEYTAIDLTVTYKIYGNCISTLSLAENQEC